ncbi:MAG: hypothetical protein AB8G14_07020 [Ilumatobacter sp.]
MKTSRTTSILSVLATSALVLSACGGSDAASNADPCEVAQTVADAFEEGDAAESAEDALAALANFASTLEDLAKAAPDDLKADIELLADGTRQLADSDPDEGPSDEVLAIVDGDEYDAAGERLEDYIQGTCGLDFG